MNNISFDVIKKCLSHIVSHTYKIVGAYLILTDNDEGVKYAGKKYLQYTNTL